MESVSSTTAADADSSMLRGAATSAYDETVASERRRLELAASKSLFPDPDSEVDWGMKGLLGPVRNQGPCGACWAFSTIGAIEAAIAIEKFSAFPSPLDPSNMGLVTPLSEQELIDCDTNYEHGCIKQNHTTCSRLNVCNTCFLSSGISIPSSVPK